MAPVRRLLELKRASYTPWSVDMSVELLDGKIEDIYEGYRQIPFKKLPQNLACGVARLTLHGEFEGWRFCYWLRKPSDKRGQKYCPQFDYPRRIVMEKVDEPALTPPPPAEAKPRRRFNSFSQMLRKIRTAPESNGDKAAQASPPLQPLTHATTTFTMEPVDTLDQIAPMNTAEAVELQERLERISLASISEAADDCVAGGDAGGAESAPSGGSSMGER